MNNEQLQELKTWAEKCSGLNLLVSRTAFMKLIALVERLTNLPPSTFPEARIREIALANGFTIKPGEADLRRYVYHTIQEVVREAVAAERATAAPAESVDTAWLNQRLATYTAAISRGSIADVNNAFTMLAGDASSRIEAAREAGRQEMRAAVEYEQRHAAESETALTTEKDRADTERARAERAEAALASRPAVDLSKLNRYCHTESGELCMAEPSDTPDPDSFVRYGSVQALLSGKAEAPTGCSKDPACCPNNEGHGCDCSDSASIQQATSASADGLPPLPEPKKRE